MVVFMKKKLAGKCLTDSVLRESGRRGAGYFLAPLIILLACHCFLSACTVDLPGLFVSHNLDERVKERNTFNFLLPSQRTITLPAEYSFLVLADTHIKNGSTDGLEKLANVIAASSGDPGNEIKFVVIAGDITQCGDATDINVFKTIAGTLGAPCYPVIGNHDIYFNTWTNWKNLIGSSIYRIDSDNATLFMLDSANAYFGKVQLDWLENELKTAKGRVFVFTHTNLFVESPADIQELTDYRERARIISMLKGRCDIMFSGHLHKRIISEAGGVKYVAIDDYVDAKMYCRVSVKNSGVTYVFEKLR
jgi:predicted phosphodiesterase